MAECLVDTNVVVYAYDPRDPRKNLISREILADLAEAEQGSLTAQVLGEFYRVATRKLPHPLSQTEAERCITAFARTWTVYDTTRWTMLEAARGTRQYGFSFWDAVIWATAKLNQVPNILSEDFSAGALVEGVRFVNPYAPGFDRKTLLQGYR